MSAIVEQALINSPLIVPSADDLPPLTIRQQNFVKHYLDPNNYRNGTKAAKLAGFQGDDNTLGVCAYDLLRNSKIQAHIQHALKQRQISSDEVLAELGDIANAPWKDFVQVKYGPNNTILDVQLKLSEKLKALELAGKYHQLWDKPQETTPDPQAFVLAVCEAIERMRQQQASQSTHQLEAVNPTEQST